ncbi:MAG: Bax inhibitor-1/YccA family protein [Mariprofundales bacterium]
MSDFMQNLKSADQSTILVDDRIAFLGRTYGMLAGAIAAGSVGALMAQGMAFPMEHPWIMLFLMIGGIFAVQAVQHKPGINTIALLGFGALTGMAIAPLVGMVAAKNPMLVVQAFMTTAVTFVALSGYVFYSRKDFSYLKGFVWTGLIALIVLGLSNVFFFQSPVIALAGAAVGVLLFSAFILYDTSNILRTYSSNDHIAAALTLYLDVFLLFQNLLALFYGMSDD